MSYKYRSRRSIRRLQRKSKRNFIFTLIIIAILGYSTLTWVLPNFIGGIGFVKNKINPPQKTIVQASNTSNLAPPVINIPYEATNSAQIDIKGFGTPNSKVKLYIDDETKQTIDVEGDGSFTFPNVSLNLGTNNIYTTSVDDRNKESLPSKTIKLIFDNQQPPLSINQPEDNKKIQGGDKKVTVSGKTDPGIYVFINGTQVIVDKEGNFSSDQSLNEGNNTISIKAVDIATNVTEIQRQVNYTP